MKDIIIEIIYLSLTSIVPSTVAILLPLVGAFWIFKVREKTVAEGKIFELGREIANILQSKEIRGPIDGVSYSYIDKALHKTEEKNRDRAIKAILRDHLYFFKFGEETSEEEKREAATIVVAIATERIQSLVPPTVNWSGRGVVYNPFGEDIETKDNYYPFGTKLYREWIENFGARYNDLWAITNSRHTFFKNFLSGYKDSSIGIDEDFITKWLDDINKRIKDIHPIHAKLLTQIQIIDTQIDLSRLGRDIRFIALYGCILAGVGFFAPKILHLVDLSSLKNILSLTLATLLSYLLIFIRVISGIQPVTEKNVQRNIFMPRLASNLESMEKECMRYKPQMINNILSLDSELKLSNSLKETLSALVNKIEIFNEYSAILYKKAEEFIKPLKSEFTTQEENTQSFSVNILELGNKEFSLEDIKSRILKEEYIFNFSYEEIHSSRNIFTINLAELDRKQRLALCSRLEDLRSSINNLSIYKTTILALNELQKLRIAALIKVEQSYNKSTNKGDGVH